MKNVIIAGAAVGIAYIGGYAAAIGGIYLGEKTCQGAAKAANKIKKWKHRKGEFVSKKIYTGTVNGEKVLNVEVVEVTRVRA